MRGLIILLAIIILIPTFMGRVSFDALMELMKNPGQITFQQVLKTLEAPFSQIVNFYKESIPALLKQYFSYFNIDLTKIDIKKFGK